MSTQPSPEQPKSKIIVDEDWKSQARAEKEALERRVHQEQAAGPGQPSATHQSTAGQPAPGEIPPLPPATLAVLLTTLATQALVALGQIPHPVSGKPEVHLDEAKHFIDTLSVLETKTAGNRTPEETRLLDNLLHELRLGYVETERHLAAAR